MYCLKLPIKTEFKGIYLNSMQMLYYDALVADLLQVSYFLEEKFLIKFLTSGM